MIALIVIGAVILFFAALLALPIHLTILCGEKVSLHVRVLCFPFRLFPKKQKKIKPRQYSEKNLEKARRRAEKKAARKAACAEKKLKKKQKKAANTPTSPQTGAEKPTLWENVVLVRALVASIFRKTGKHLRLKAARLHIRVATGDAASTAILYGAVSASLAFLLAGLDRITKLRTAKNSVAVIADYLSEKPSVDIKLIFTLRVWGALSLALSAAIAFIKTKNAQKEARKRKKADQTANIPSK